MPVVVLASPAPAGFGWLLQNIPGAAPTSASGHISLCFPGSFWIYDVKHTSFFCPNEMLPAEVAVLGCCFFILMASQRPELVCMKLLQMLPSKV